MNVVVAIAQNLMIIVFESNSISHHSLSSFYLAFFRTYWHSWKSLHIIEKNNYLASQSEVALMWDIRLFVDKGTSTISIRTAQLGPKNIRDRYKNLNVFNPIRARYNPLLESKYVCQKYWQIQRPLACITCINILTNETNICRYKVISVEMFFYSHLSSVALEEKFS